MLIKTYRKTCIFFSISRKNTHANLWSEMRSFPSSSTLLRVQCNHASASTYLMHIWVSAERLIIRMTHYGRAICGWLCRWIIGSSYILSCSTKLHCTAPCVEVISPAICRGRECRSQRINEYGFHKCWKGGGGHHENSVCLQGGKTNKKELCYSKLMYMVWQGGTNLPAH